MISDNYTSHYDFWLRINMYMCASFSKPAPNNLILNADIQARVRAVKLFAVGGSAHTECNYHNFR